MAPEVDAPARGEPLGRVSPGMVACHVLRAPAPEDANQPLRCREVVAAVVQLHPVAAPGEGDVAAVRIQPGRGQHMGAVRRHALRVLDRGGVAAVDPVVVLQVEADGATILGAHGHRLAVDVRDAAQRAVLHAESTVVLHEHHAVAGGEAAFAALDPRDGTPGRRSVATRRPARRRGPPCGRRWSEAHGGRTRAAVEVKAMSATHTLSTPSAGKSRRTRSWAVRRPSA
ncbi:hypothetical protein [Palleronia rufa]|uniref:hypothetical protein n=1 Tax=Palleronia rufa TaxID=1530186 RepID=UPI001F287793|nr:hypothetical protein [Palleronia rufa]